MIPRKANRKLRQVYLDPTCNKPTDPLCLHLIALDLHRNLQTNLLCRNSQFYDRACLAAPRSVHRLTWTHPYALSALSFPPNRA